MYLDLYKIDGTQNNDTNPCFGNPDTYPQFQEKLEDFKSLLIDLVKNNESKTFYKFGDGDFFFLTGQSVGSATPGRRALSKHFTQIDHLAFKTGAQRCDYYTCEIYPENRTSTTHLPRMHRLTTKNDNLTFFVLIFFGKP